jgi:hypothetical protein
MISALTAVRDNVNKVMAETNEAELKEKLIEALEVYKGIIMILMANTRMVRVL